MKLMSNIKSLATQERINAAKDYGKQALQYAKENPSDVLLGFIALALFDIEQDVDELEDILGD